MQSLGQRYTSKGKFNALINIEWSNDKSNYETSANKIASFTKDFAEKTMRDAAVIKIHNNTSNTNNSAIVVDTSVRVMEHGIVELFQAIMVYLLPFL